MKSTLNDDGTRTVQMEPMDALEIIEILAQQLREGDNNIMITIYDSSTSDINKTS